MLRPNPPLRRRHSSTPSRVLLALAFVAAILFTAFLARAAEPGPPAVLPVAAALR